MITTSEVKDFLESELSNPMITLSSLALLSLFHHHIILSSGLLSSSISYIHYFVLLLYLDY
ncbi:hypothetical protein LY90DRAFT_224777 [Neocallimastix californiae]|uniref:Uncharacterized protein n=1 Tax=Neocallimastix californiae TaxID=1754190 RepID=A0A1Y2E315_9FUNG|nr:hypothetical protein LY90DRAFT_224777 [Neocallimastix californiae]|eukprot:ORY65754.1 hypothetical protein LY90DRAFT_224777 [Neocallimastix californiae]